MKNTKKIIASGDLHGYPDEILIDSIIKEQPDEIYFVGDIFDQAQFSAHNGDYGEVAEEFSCEVERVSNCFQDILKSTRATITVSRGNHDDWLNKLLVALVPESARAFCQDPIDIVAARVWKDFPGRLKKTVTELNVKLPHKSFKLEKSLRYLEIVGDAYLSHLNFVASKPGEAALKLSNWLSEWVDVLGWPKPRLCIQLHVHNKSYSWTRGGHLCLVEPGMAGWSEEYKISYQAKWRPGTIGACYFEQTDGVTDLDSVRPVILRHK